MKAELIIAGITAMASLSMWLLNEWRKRVYEEHKSKESKYVSLIDNLQGFQESLYCEDKNEKSKQKNSFLREVNQCWLYCPDEVIRKAYKFLDTVNENNKSTVEECNLALGELMVAIRNDIKRKNIKSILCRKTKLEPKDFKILKST